MIGALHALATRVGVDVRYLGWRGEPVEASAEALVAVLAALGHDVRSPDDAHGALAAVDAAWWDAVTPPVVVSWDGAAAELPLRVRADLDGTWEVEVVFEDGERQVRRGRCYELPAAEHVHRNGHPWCVRRIALEAPRGVLGYHRITWRLAGPASGAAQVSGSTLWLSAPSRAFGDDARSWGVFAPLYALRSDRSGAAGDLGELDRLARHVAARGGRHLATLPMLAAFLDEPCEPSPYAPASRLQWNELYLDLTRAPGLEQSAAGRALLSSPELAVERARLAATPQIDYRAQYGWRRQVIDRVAEAAWRGGHGAELTRFARAGEVADYAAFRAIGEVERTGWGCWPEELRAAPRFAVDDLLAGRAPVDPARWRSHVYAQWAMDRQLGELAGTGAALYLDLPVGVNRDAWEVWRQRGVFVLGAGAGAPPDALFLGGQDWGLPPLHPERNRAAGWRYVIDCVRHHVRHAGMLRIDHVMGLHRLYWVPAGMRATDGVYVRYAADELYAILCLESQRHRCALVGEDLGTVPEYVPPAMRRHRLAGLHVAQFALPGQVGAPLGRPAAGQVASMNTHDTPTFAGWWRTTDVDDKLDLGLIDVEQAARERAGRIEAREAVLAAVGVEPGAPERLEPDSDAACAAALLGVTRAMAVSAASMVLVTLEDAWLEPRPQNVPGTSYERPNWRRPFALDSDAALAHPRTEALLAAAARRRADER